MHAALALNCTFLPGDSVSQARASLGSIGDLDVVNTHMSQADLVGMRSPQVRGGAALVPTRHFTAPRGGNLLSRTVFGLLDRRVSAEISISECVAEAIGTPSTVVLTGVADARVTSAAPRSQSVLMVQRLESEKATDIALDAWSRADARSRGWRLRIAGDGSQRPALEEQARSLGIAGTVDFLGARRDVAALLDDAALFVAPTPSEAFGLSAAEAMAHAVPVVASAGGGHLETVGSVEGAALFAPGDAAAAAAQIDALASDPDRRIAYGAALQDFQREKLTIDRWARETLAVFEGAAR